MKDEILFHGSHTGIIGKIEPSSREKCDFGKGFYMGTKEMQAKALIANDDNPIIYKVKFALSEIPEKRILTLEGQDWICAVLACRKRVPEYNKLKSAKMWVKDLQKYDVIIGEIADDAMNDAIQRFIDRGLTDKGLIDCLQSRNIGKQFVAKSEFACSKIKIISEKKLYGKEAEDARVWGHSTQKENIKLVDRMASKHFGDGVLIDKFILREKAKTKKDIER